MLFPFSWLFAAAFLFLHITCAGPTRRSLLSDGSGFNDAKPQNVPSLTAVVRSPRCHFADWFSHGRAASALALHERASIFENIAARWQVVINHWMPFDLSSGATSTLSNMYAGVKTIISSKSALQAPQNLVSFSYGSLTLVFECASQVIRWGDLADLVNILERALEVPGLAALFRVIFYAAKGFVISGVVTVGWLAIRDQIYP